jgi:hypothetical protein
MATYFLLNNVLGAIWFPAIFCKGKGCQLWQLQKMLLKIWAPQNMAKANSMIHGPYKQ